ncbi:ABC-type Fe3+-hydroxamate transport system, periplasmic component [Sanguibacter keddieii DSM 10542]|uniref:ABC-type Fe3+-hydroxamate transport system, periplasmic component n=2 Tax=Sanguibacter keddieii TaxID=60920 RepID=D1BGA0_SANKS|nr:ABC-type Fe3+-hydroxamate transport system, periplasmic component [Sanguibacter keddieii DSM 10542]
MPPALTRAQSRALPSAAPRTSVALAAAGVAAMLLTACSTTSDAATSADGTSAATGSATRTVDSEFGEVTLPTDPQAALGMYTTDLDMLITLGVPLAQSQPIRDNGYSTFPSFFDQEALEGITPFTNFPEFSYESILAAQPDLVVNGLGYDESIGEKLSEIAPTYSFNGFDGSDWRVKFEALAEALGRTAEHDAWTEKYQAKVDDIRARLDAAGLDPVVGSVGVNDDQVTVSCYGTPCLVFDDLGLDITPLSDGEGAYLSFEEVGQLEGIDAVFTSMPPETDGSFADSFEALAGNAVWQQLPFVTEGQIFTSDLEMIYGSPSGQYAFLEEVEKALLP